MNLSDFERENCVRLIAGTGTGFDAYVVHKARQLAKSAPEWHSGLPGDVAEALGVKRAAEARRALEWFKRNP